MIKELHQIYNNFIKQEKQNKQIEQVDQVDVDVMDINMMKIENKYRDA